MDKKNERPSIFRNEKQWRIEPIAYEKNILTDHTLIVCQHCHTVFFDRVIKNAAETAAPDFYHLVSQGI